MLQLLGSRPCKATEQKAGQSWLSVNPELVPSYNETVSVGSAKSGEI